MIGETALIPQHDIDQANFDIVEVISKRISLKKGGKNWSACCPFHKEKSPSFTVSEDKGMFYCFGCGAGGDAVKFVMEYEGLSFRDAVASIIGRMSVTVTPEMVQKKAQAMRVSYPPGHCEAPDKVAKLIPRLERAQQHDYLKSRNTAPFGEIYTVNGVLMVFVENGSREDPNVAAIQESGITWLAGGPTYGATAQLLPECVCDPEAHEFDNEIILCLDYATAWRIWWARKGKSIVLAAIDPSNFIWMQYQKKSVFTMIAAYPEEIDDLVERGHAVYPISHDPYAKLDTGTTPA